MVVCHAFVVVGLIMRLCASLIVLTIHSTQFVAPTSAAMFTATPPRISRRSVVAVTRPA
jgi:uncharacterized membrane protein YphA (DoxX/SURF4 family)